MSEGGGLNSENKMTITAVVERLLGNGGAHEELDDGYIPDTLVP